MLIKFLNDKLENNNKLQQKFQQISTFLCESAISNSSIVFFYHILSPSLLFYLQI